LKTVLSHSQLKLRYLISL